MLHVLEQGPVLQALGKAALTSFKKPSASAVPSMPGPWLEATVRPRSAELLRDYIRHVGGDPAAYRQTVPAHLFPQWTFPLGARLLQGLPYPLTKILNAGCRMEQNAPLPAGEDLRIRARLEAVDVQENRVLITQRFLTGTVSQPEALVSEIRALVPLASGARDGKAPKGAAKKAPVTVPVQAREIGFLRVPRDAGLEFAKLTGDFNPIHWIPAAARASGFKSCILHGFATVARAVEVLNRQVYSGSARGWHALDVRFVRPLVLPARVGVYIDGEQRIFVGDAPGGVAYMEGRWESAGANRGTLEG
jgi:hypothetical protein